MNLVRWNPIRELEEMSDRLNRLFNRGVSKRVNGEERLAMADWTPSVDITETDQEFVLKAELPEVKKNDVRITVENGVLTLQGERKQEREEKGRKYHRVERAYGQFVRSFSLPDTVDETRVKAESKDGVLHIHLPKTHKAKPKAIEINVA